MIDLLFDFLGEKVIVRINRDHITFGNTSQGAYMASIDGLKLDKFGVEKEFPELKDKDNWRQEAIKRFKKKIKKMKTEEKISRYIIEDLKKYGYKPLYKQKQGFRVEKLI